MAEPTTRPDPTRVHEDPTWVRWTLVSIAIAIMTFLVVIPLVDVFVEAFAAGPAAYWRNLVKDADTLHSIWLTLMVAPSKEAASSVSASTVSSTGCTARTTNGSPRNVSTSTTASVE